MPKLIVSIDGVAIKELQLTKEHTTLGRRPYNDIVIDNLAISGEHAVLHMNDKGVEAEDLRSTNGTYVNGKAIQRQWLYDNDTIDLGKYKILFLTENEAENQNPDKTTGLRPSVAPPASGTRLPLGVARSEAIAPSLPPEPPPASTLVPLAPAAAYTPSKPVATATIRVLSGTAIGREVPLTKVVTTIGKPGVAVAAITRRQHGYVLTHIEGTHMPTHNGSPIGTDPVPLHDGDLLELAGTEMQFILGG